MDDLAKMSGPQLVEFYNGLAAKYGLETTKRFSTAEAGRKRIRKVLDEHATNSKSSIVIEEPADKTPTPPPAPREKKQVARRGAPPRPPAEPKPAKAKKVSKKASGEPRKVRGFRFVFPFKGTIKDPKPNTKRMITLKLLLRPEGTTHAEVLKATKWDIEPGGDAGIRTAYEAIRLCHGHHGYGLDHDKNGRVYAYATEKSPLPRDQRIGG